MPPKGTTAPTTAVVVVAAGSGSRLGSSLPKAFVTIAGRTLLRWSIDTALSLDPAVQVIAVIPADTDADLPVEVTCVTGASTRHDSVAAGIAAIGPEVRTVLVHDAARPFTPRAQFERVIAAVEASGHGIVPALFVTDTIKRVHAGAVTETVDRAQLAAVQTPQGFPAEKLRRAYNSAKAVETDDAAVFAAAGNAVTIVEGDADAFKITTPADLRRAELMHGEPTRSTGGGLRTGVGVDVHAYDDESPLWLGGLHWPGERGLAGHSDGDALSHAICDALLSAAGLGDLGSRFGTADPRFANAHADVFITETVALVIGAGYTIANVAAQVIGNAPKVGPRRVELEARLSALVGAPVSVSATTSDHLGFTGRGEGVAVMANALIERTQ